MISRSDLLFVCLKLKSRIFCILPRSLSLIIGKGIGLLLYYFGPLRKRVAITNIGIALPQKTPSEIQSILKKCYIHFGMLISDFLRLPRLNEKNISDIINLDSTTKKLLEENTPSIIMTGHFGNWEMFLPVLGYNGFNITGVAQIQKNKAGEKFFNWLRNCKNSTLIAKKNPIKEINKILDKGNHLLLVSDQNAGARGTINNFFGMPTSTPKGAAILNTKKNIPIIMVFIMMNSDYSYSMYSKELITQSSSKTQRIIDINQTYNNELEKIIKKHPEQYFWFHKKWSKKNYK